MILNFYHANKSGKGSAVSFNYDAKTDTVYSQIIKQVSYDENTKKGLFKNGEKTSIKLDNLAICGILDTIDYNRGEAGFSVFHGTEKATKSINFKPYSKDGNQIGFSYSITQTIKESNEKGSFFIGLNFAEARLLKEYLGWCLFMIFSNQNNPLDSQIAKQSFVNKSPEKTSNNTEDQIL